MYDTYNWPSTHLKNVRITVNLLCQKWQTPSWTFCAQTKFRAKEIVWVRDEEER